jgi:hypothetical protein
MRCRGALVSREKKPWEASFSVRSFRGVLQRDSRPISRHSHEALVAVTEGVLRFDSGFEEPSKTPRTTFHGSPLDSDATYTHAYICECVQHFVAKYARSSDRSIHAFCSMWSVGKSFWHKIRRTFSNTNFWANLNYMQYFADVTFLLVRKIRKKLYVAQKYFPLLKNITF